ncbi:hypothetical protein D3C81_1928700 [compost metagenome]
MVRLVSRSTDCCSRSDSACMAVMSVVVPIMRSGLPSRSRLTTLPRLEIHL